MTQPVSLTFAGLEWPSSGTVILPVGENVDFGKLEKVIDAELAKFLTAAARQEGFTGKYKTATSITAPVESGVRKVLLVGLGSPDDTEEAGENRWVNLGGFIRGQLNNSKDSEAHLLVDIAEDKNGQIASAMMFGMGLRDYKFSKYKTTRKKQKDTNNRKLKKVVCQTDDVKAARKAFKTHKAIMEGMITARNLVNEPANILYPETFAERIQELEDLGLEVEILDEKQMEKLGMGSLLAVGQGSMRASRLAVMQWKGGKDKDKPVAFVGKGVTFDTGGISLKPSANMGDMKGDMGGAACVTGLMQTLAARKAKVNAVGVVGLVENMPGGNAIRPGDIVTSMSGQSIEILNTDAEGRLVLADALWYTQDRFKPQFMINLATLTGAILVALAQEYAGLFSNNDSLSEKLTKAGQETDEKVWRMPMGKCFDKMIDSKNADMKNIGGRYAGSITAAQFLQRYVNDTPWAHIDIAGTAMGSPASDINQSWGSGFGVRLLNQLIASHYE